MKTIIRIAAILILATMALQGIAQPTINICAGDSAVLTAINSSGLSNPSYSLNPGGITSQSPTFTVAPSGPSVVTYTLYVTGTNSNSAIATTSNEVILWASGVTYSLISSPASHTLGCGSKSVCVVNIFAETAPVAGGVVSYAFLAPGSSTVIPNSAFSYTPSLLHADVPGTWSVVVRDANNLCTYWSTVNIIANTAPPVIGSISVLQNPLTCANPTTMVYPAPAPALQFNWLVPTVAGVISLVNPTVSVNSNPVAPTQSIAVTLTLVATDPGNLCQSTAIVPIYQNLYAPNAVIGSGAGPMACTHSVQLTNNSTLGEPLGAFTVTAPIVAFLWEGPSPQPTLGASSSYTAYTTGIYTMNVIDQNNGCISTAMYNVTGNMLMPVAAFVHTVTNGVAVFNDASANTGSNTTYYWDFGDGNTSTLQNPTHTYASAGAQLVKLKVSNAALGLCPDSVIQSVNVSGIACVANSGFSMVPTATAQVWNVTPSYPWNVTAASWSWGDGSTSDTLYTSHQYPVAGLYNICLSVTVSCVASSSTCTTYSVYRTSQAALILEINVTAPDLATGVANIEADGQLSWNIVPNPNTGEFNLNLNTTKSESMRVIICDLTGRIVYKQSNESDSNSMSVHSGHLPPGMYLVTLETDKQKITKRMVVYH